MQVNKVCLCGNEQSEPDWDREWEGQVAINHITTAPVGGPVLQVFYSHISEGGTGG